MNIKLSVIVPTYNRSKLLNNTLESISNQTFNKEDFEVIVVDNGSTDNTKGVTFQFQNKINHLYYYYDATPGLHVGRHIGLKRAKSEILVYTDDDIEASPIWLEGIWESFQDKEVVLVGGKNLTKYEVKPPFWILEMWYRLNKFGHLIGELSILDFGNEVKEISPYFVFGCNFSVRKKIIESAHGFHPDAMPFDLIHFRGDGETTISKYIETNELKTIYNPKASVCHVVTSERLTVDYFCRRAFFQGISDSFTQLREKDAKNSESVTLKRKLKQWIHYYKNQLSTILQATRYTESEKQRFKSYTIGFEYHQKMYKSNQDVKKWVLKENYF